MIQVPQTFMDSIHGPKTWRVQISTPGAAWENINDLWQDVPVGAEIVKPLGTLAQATEDPSPFSFVGPDIQLTARNINGFWTNSLGTGRLDANDITYLRLETSISPTSITLIQGPIDNVTAQKQAGDLVTFVVRGTLNALDGKLAQEFCERRPIGAMQCQGGSPQYYGFPAKFYGWLLVQPRGGADGLYKLKYDSGKHEVSFDNGPAVNLDSTVPEFLLTGESGAVISCIYNPGSTAMECGQPTADVEEWIQQIRVDIAPNNWIYFLVDSHPATSLGKFKSGLNALVDLDISSISNLMLKSGEPAIHHWEEMGDMNPCAVVGSSQNWWLVSSYAGTYKGIYRMGLMTDDPMNPGLSHLSDYVAIKFKKIGNDILALCDTSTNNDAFLNNAVITDYVVIKITATTITAYTLTNNPIFWRSFDFYSATVAYCVWQDSADSGHIVEIDITHDTWATRGSSFTVAGNSLLPGCLVDSPAEDYYVCFAAFQVGNDIQVWSNGWHITGVAFSQVQLDISIDPLEGLGPVQCVPSITQAGAQGLYDIYSGVMLLIDNIFTNRGVGSGWYYNNKRLITGGTVYCVNYSQQASIYLRRTVGNIGSYMNGATTYLYCPLITTNVVGKTLVFTTGANSGTQKTIAAQEIIQSYIVNPWGGGGFYYGTKLSFTAVGSAISSGDQFGIYYGGALLSESSVNKVDDISGVTILDTFVSYAAGKYIETKSYMDYNAPTRLPMGNIAGKVFAEIQALTNPRCIDGDGYGKFLSCGRTGFVFVDYSGATVQKRQIGNNLWENKSVREAIEEVATHCNCYIFPSEHARKLTLQYRGSYPESVGGITRTQYQFDGSWSPRTVINVLDLDGERRGVIYADKFGQTLSINSPQTDVSNRKSVADDIWTHLSQSGRWHDIIADWLIWFEPGDVVQLTIDGSTVKPCMIISTEADPESCSIRAKLLEIV